MFSFSDFLTFLSELLRMLGLLVFGVAASWFTLFTFRGRTWQLQITAFLGFFLLAALISFSTPAAGLGGFALGAGATMLFLGLKNKPDTKEKDESEQ